MESLPETMLEAHLDEDTNVTLHTVPVPKITDPSQILIKVVCSGCNPKDWKMPANHLKTIGHCPNSGDDIAGVVVAVGDDVLDFRPGDRVAALHQLGAPHGSFAEYAIANDFSTFNIGPNITFEEAATFPMTTIMAAIGLFAMLRVSHGPWAPHAAEGRRTPLLIYGAASGVGSMALKMAQITNIHPVICVAGGGIPLVESLIDKSQGDAVIDYRKGDDAVVQGIKDALKGEKLEYAFDVVSEKGSWINIAKVLDPHTGKITLVLPMKHAEIPETVEQTSTMAGSLWPQLRAREDIKESASQVGNIGIEHNGPEFGLVFSKLLAKWIREGKIRAPTFDVAEGGLRGVSGALKRLRAGESGKKFVFRIADTPELKGQ